MLIELIVFFRGVVPAVNGTPGASQANRNKILLKCGRVQTFGRDGNESYLVLSTYTACSSLILSKLSFTNRCTSEPSQKQF